MLQEAITGPYVDYNYYSETYGGNKIPKDSFDACEKRAEAVLHRISFDRVKRLPEIPDMVKDAICAMAEIDYQEEKKTPGVKSENSDGYAVTYADSGNTTGASGRVALMHQEASIYLGNTGLLYKGVSRKYDCEQ